MLSRLRGLYTRGLSPVARLLLRAGLSPSVVTVAGTLAVVLGAVWFLGRGQLVAGSLWVAVFLLADGLDGTMARTSGRVTRFGGFLDSTADRLADGTILAVLAWWSATQGDRVGAGLALAALVGGFLVSYARARAEVEGWTGSGGWFERSDRLVVVLAGSLAVGLGAPMVVLWVALGMVALGSATTVAQRVAGAARQASDRDLRAAH